MEWEIWRHDGPNPGVKATPPTAGRNDENNAYYAELTAPYGDADGVCKQKLRVLALESAYVRVQL